MTTGFDTAITCRVAVAVTPPPAGPGPPYIPIGC